jgi:hypothetical protein
MADFLCFICQDGMYAAGVDALSVQSLSRSRRPHPPVCIYVLPPSTLFALASLSSTSSSVLSAVAHSSGSRTPTLPFVSQP